jgi:hypothetical protein
VADYKDSRVLAYNLDSGNNLVDHTPDYVLGQSNFSHSDQLTTQSGMDHPAGLFYDNSDNRLFVGDTNNNRILVFDLSSGITNGMNANNVLGQPNFTSSAHNSTQDGLNNPLGGMAYDLGTHRFYVGDSRNHRVLVYDLSGGITNGMDASFVIGQPDFTTVNPATSQNGLDFPYGMAIDTVHHRLFVAEWGNAGRVMVYDTNNLANGMNASNVLGEADFTSSNSASNTGDTPDAKSFGPAGLSYDPVHQKLFVEDANAYRILVFDVSAITNNQDAVGVLGEADFTSESYAETSATAMDDPEGFSDYYDTGNNRLYVSDAGNARVLVFDFARITTGPLGSASVGSSYNQPIVVTGDQGTKAFAITAGSLPAGLTLNATSGVISGTPTTLGVSSFTLAVTDDNGIVGSYTDSKNYSLTIASPSATPTPTPIPTPTPQQQPAGADKTTGGANPTVDSATTPDSTSPDQTITLNSFTDFSSDAGRTIDNLKVGDILRFCLNIAGTCDPSSPDYHSITVKNIDLAAGTVTLTFASTPTDYIFHLSVLQAVDVDHDGINDISGTLTGLTATTASFNFKNLVKTSANIDSPPSVAKTPVNSTPMNSTSLWWLGGVVAGLVIVVGAVVWRQRVRRNSE